MELGVLEMLKKGINMPQRFAFVFTIVVLVGSTLIAASANGETPFSRDTNGDGYLQILLPIAIPSPRVVTGGFGSVWRQELWVANNSDQPFFTLQPQGTCAPGGPCPPSLQPGEVTSWFSMENNNFEGGALFALAPEDGEHIQISSRLLETSRRAQPAGVEIPIIREDDFRTGTITLAGIPTGAGIRSRLRVYDPRAGDDRAVRVEVLTLDGAVLGERTVHLGNNPTAPPTYLPKFPLPSYGVIGDLETEFPALGDVDRYHVRITPLGGIEFWAFVAVTDDDSQHLLLITPQ